MSQSRPSDGSTTPDGEDKRPGKAARPGGPLRRALDDLSSTSDALDKARSALRAEADGRQEERKRNADLIRDLRRKLHASERDLEYARRHVQDERAEREQAEEREVAALRRAEDADRTASEHQERLEELTGAQEDAVRVVAEKAEALEQELAEAQAEIRRTEASHATVRERIVTLERELGEARARAVRLTDSRDEERRARAELESQLERMQRELANSLDRGEELIRTVDTAGKVERGLQRYADKKEAQVVASERLLIEARQRLARIGNDIVAARARLAISPRRAGGEESAQALG